MTTARRDQAPNVESPEERALLERCRTLDVPVLRLAPDAEARWASLPSAALRGLLTAPALREAIRNATSAWASADDEPGAAHEAVDVTPGVWLLPVPLHDRRRVIGWLAPLVCSPQGLDDGRFRSLCQSAGLDHAAVVQLLAPVAGFNRQGADVLAHLLGWAHQDREELERHESAVCEFSQQLAESYEELSLLYKLGQSMNELVHPDRFLGLVCDELFATLAFGWVACWLKPGAPNLPRLRSSFVVRGEAPEPRESLPERFETMLSRLPADRPSVVQPEDVADLGLTSQRNALLVQPLRADGQLIGAIVAGDRVDGAEIRSADLKLTDAAGANLRVLLQNAALYDEQQATFLGTLRALTSAIDAKDRYTRGHSERVAHLASALARALGYDEQATDRIHICGLVHDVGKIGVPEAVLGKPGRLTDSEFELIKAHPEIGHRILHDIPQLADVLPGVLGHHERWDGRGYPHGLKGEDIPTIARIVGLADAFDAMSSTRTYRSAMPRPQVLDEIMSCAGAQFDPAMAREFVTLSFGEYDRLVRRHLREERGATGEAA